MLQIAVCDDEKYIAEELRGQIEAAFQKQGQPARVLAFSDIRSLFAEKSPVPYDAVFLDIDMPKTDGIQAGKLLRKDHADCCIIYVSSREERVFETFSVSPLRFIRKTHFYEEIDEAVSAILTWKENALPSAVVFHVNGKILSLNPFQIVYVECQSKVQYIVTPSGTEEIRSTLHTLEDTLTPYGFLKPHKGFLVNFRYVKSIAWGDMILSTGKIIPVSKYRLQDVKQTYLRLITAQLTH